MTITVFLADDHRMVRDGLRALLQEHDGLLVVGEAASGSDALRDIPLLQPDVTVMDISMPDLNGIEVTRQLRHQCSRFRAVILSMHATCEHIHQAFAAGATGYVLKEAAGSDLIAAIRAAHCDRTYLSPRVRELFPDIQADLGRDLSPLSRLSLREKEILQLVAEGHSSAAIGLRLALSPKTVETYRCRLMQKLHLHDLPSLVRFAIQHGITPP